MVEKFKIKDEWKQPNGKYACPICKKDYSKMGLSTHYYRAHTDKKFSSGNNGCYNDVEYKNKLANSNAKAVDRKLGKIEKHVVNCVICNKPIIVKERSVLFPKKKKYFCSKKCSNHRDHSFETRSKISASNSSNNIAFSCDIYYGNCKFCNKLFAGRKKSKRYCSISCSSKHKYKDLDKTTLKYYRKLCRFNFALNSYPNEYDFDLIRKYGWYKAKNRGNNLNGVSRDHIISIKYGYDNGILPSIISHPANCQLLRHNDNVSKNSNCDITLEELIEKIRLWDIKFKSY